MIKALIARLRRRSTTAPVTPEEWTEAIERLAAERERGGETLQ